MPTTKGIVTTQNPHYLQLHLPKTDNGFGLTNEGFRGIGIRKGADYSFSLFARAATETPKGLRIELTDANGKILGQGRMEGFNSQWKQYSLRLRADLVQPLADRNLLRHSAR
jgi:alpha-L-arabinofuranosidase